MRFRVNDDQPSEEHPSGPQQASVGPFPDAALAALHAAQEELGRAKARALQAEGAWEGDPTEQNQRVLDGARAYALKCHVECDLLWKALKTAMVQAGMLTRGKGLPRAE